MIKYDITDMRNLLGECRENKLNNDHFLSDARNVFYQGNLI